MKCNASQLVLKYLFSYKSLLCNAWRSRIYYYSSATTFADVCGDVEAFIEEQPSGVKILRNVRDVGLCHEYIGDALIAFIKRKPSFFKDAMVSKKHFFLVPAWKRAMTFVFMLRFLSGKKGMHALVSLLFCL